MIYNGKEIKKFGFGLMRLPVLEGEIDLEHVKKMVDTFLENGFTYFDTAYGYHNQKSEGAIKKCLVDRYSRESFQLATKLPAWAGAKTKEEAEQMFYTSLERTGAGYFDFYLLHNLGSNRTQLYESYELWDFVAKRKEEGLIKKLGFSMHDNAAALEKILTAHPEVDFVQLQINYADWDNATIQSRQCYEVALKHNKPVVIMEPLRGGALANPPKAVAKVFDETGSEKSYAEWGLSFAASLENSFMVLSGMSTIEQMQENVTFMKEFIPLSDEEQQVIGKAQKALDAIPSISCTNCQYCVKECPMGISIPDVFDAMNRYLLFGDMEGAKQAYIGVSNKGNNASACIACKRCEAVCPQSIQISEELKKVDSTLIIS